LLSREADIGGGMFDIAKNTDEDALRVRDKPGFMV
jgi:hypothetical protein